jgi:hypothetical protein
VDFLQYTDLIPHWRHSKTRMTKKEYTAPPQHPTYTILENVCRDEWDNSTSNYKYRICSAVCLYSSTANFRKIGSRREVSAQF